MGFWIRVFEKTCKSQKTVCDLESLHQHSFADVREKFYYSSHMMMVVSTSGVVILLLEMQSSGILMIFCRRRYKQAYKHSRFVSANKVLDALGQAN